MEREKRVERAKGGKCSPTLELERMGTEQRKRTDTCTPRSAKTEDGAERNSEEEVRELRLATQVSHPVCELTAKGLRGPAQLGGDRASPRGEWASFPYVAGAGSRMGRPVAVP